MDWTHAFASTFARCFSHISPDCTNASPHSRKAIEIRLFGLCQSVPHTLSRRLSRSAHQRIALPVNLFIGAPMWTVWTPNGRSGLHLPVWHGLLHACPQTIRDGQLTSQWTSLGTRLAASQPELLSSASGLRLDRRDADHGRARGGGAIRQHVADRAHLSAGAHPASSSIRRWPKSRMRRASCSTRCSTRS